MYDEHFMSYERNIYKPSTEINMIYTLFQEQDLLASSWSPLGNRYAVDEKVLPLQVLIML